MMHDRQLDEALRDAAQPVAARVQAPSARKLLDEIVRSDPAVPAAPVAMRAARRRPLLVTAGAALALTAAAVVTVNGIQADSAYASWTPEPSPLPAAEAQLIVDRCLPAPGSAGSRVVIGERRGDYAYVNVLTAEGSITCFRDHDGRVRDTSVLASPVDAARLGAKGVELYAWPQLHTAEGYARLMAGRLGSQVTAVEITVRGASGDVVRTVQATVHGGFFAAWYPEPLAQADTDTTSLTLRLGDGGTVGGLSASDLMDEPKLD
ncbi:hypothetical protein ACTOB_005484 [Actinoplanes oblitus]|uniref:Uncharacterized protein n=1 Tax=Actinoplanes oblitus TaxID=3040509 RepID=A0ABY8W6N0_9ACTN|nr:hypothetical protein [Actinoplanes oblitus]WIM93504.1 hypothetical protein ACTOB_005484 [Actinoplanes oblitus]